MEKATSDKILFEAMQSASEINDARGGQNAFCKLYRKYYKALVIFATHTPGMRQEEAENAVQDVMLDFWNRRKSITIRTSVSSFLYSAVRNKCLQQIYRGQVNERYASSLRLSLLQDGFMDYHDLYSHREIHIILKKVLDSMPEVQRTAFELSRIQLMSYNDIAKKTGVSEKTVEYRISQALRKLRLALADFIP